jgi:hypothetical protein
MRRKNYYAVLQDEFRRADSQPIEGGRTREQLEAQIADITAALSGPLDNASRIGLCADRRQLRRELENLALVAK